MLGDAIVRDFVAAVSQHWLTVTVSLPDPECPLQHKSEPAPELHTPEVPQATGLPWQVRLQPGFGQALWQSALVLQDTVGFVAGHFEPGNS